MLTAYGYAELINRLLTTCRYVDLPPHFTSEVKIPDINPYVFEWHDKIFLKNGLRLEVTDYAIFSPQGGMIERKFMYDLREVDTGQLVWRICNHGSWHLNDEPCHVHCDPSKPDERLEFWPTSDKTTFDYVMHCLKNHYENIPQEWEEKAK